MFWKLVIDNEQCLNWFVKGFLFTSRESCVCNCLRSREPFKQRRWGFFIFSKTPRYSPLPNGRRLELPQNIKKGKRYSRIKGNSKRQEILEPHLAIKIGQWPCPGLVAQWVPRSPATTSASLPNAAPNTILRHPFSNWQCTKDKDKWRHEDKRPYRIGHCNNDQWTLNIRTQRLTCKCMSLL